LPTRDVLLARFAGLLASPMSTMAGLLKAIPQNFAYGLSALIDSKGGVVAPAEDKVEEVAETPAGVEEAAPAASEDDATPVADVAVEDEAPAAEPEAEAPVTDEAPAAEPEADAPEVSQDTEAEPAE
jgi:large subunit ribosomal protein L10